PAYMSPEQLDGGDVTTRSDIYSLGLVLYELFTGKRAFNATSLAELISLRRSDTTPTSPAELVPDLDPLVERVIFRCLARDPAKRPVSALQVAAALPGGDPVAVALLASALVLMVATCLLAKRVALFTRVPLNKSPEVLRDRASDLVKKFGYASTGDSAYGMGRDSDYLSYINQNDLSPSRWDQLNSGRPASIYFWYRQASRPLYASQDGVVTEYRPATAEPGMITLTLDTLGYLRSFEAAPQARVRVESHTTDWSTVLMESGLDQSK